jgi:hypothetical protein
MRRTRTILLRRAVICAAGLFVFALGLSLTSAFFVLWSPDGYNAVTLYDGQASVMGCGQGPWQPGWRFGEFSGIDWEGPSWHVASRNNYVIQLPMWIPMAFAGVALVTSAALWRRDCSYNTRARRGRCLSCGYDLSGITGPCPECGKERKA